MLNNKLPAEHVQNIIREAVECEREFICESLPVDLIGKIIFHLFSLRL